MNLPKMTQLITTEWSYPINTYTSFAHHQTMLLFVIYGLSRLTLPCIFITLSGVQRRMVLVVIFFNIGIKHDFLRINICLAPTEMLKPEPERRGFQPLPRGPADVNVSEKHVWSLLLHRAMF